MKRSILSKSFSGYLLVIILLSILILIFTPYAVKPYFHGRIKDDLEHLALLLEEYLRLHEGRSAQELDTLVKDLGRKLNTRITVIDLNGTVTADSEEDPSRMENHKHRPEIKKAIEGNTGTDIRLSRTVNQEMLYVAVPLKRSGNTVGVVRVSVFLKEIDSLLGRLKINIYSVSLIVILLSLVIALIFSKTLSSPIRALVKSAGKIADGDFNTRVSLKSKDELKDLGDSFNIMAEQIQSLFNEQKIQKEEFASIISSIREGILVINGQNVITLCNKGAEHALGDIQLTGRLYNEAVEDQPFRKFIREAIKEQKESSGEIEYKGRYFLCSTTHVQAKKETILLLHDITGIKEMEKLKKDFIANVSHELRTPLTAIKGYIETLAGEVDHKNSEYVEILKRHTDRLVNIVHDLLVLSSFEEKGFELDREYISPEKAIDEVIKMFTQKCSVKGLALKSDCEPGLPDIYADPIKIEQALVNLIENSIRYTEQGEIVVSARKTENNMLQIEVRDTGIGIPLKYQDRIFERFFVVDKSRSREMGGTGLGLSIVKHIIQIHGGVVGVQSQPGEGSVFRLLISFNKT